MKKSRIFIVDDDVDFAESLAETLESRGHVVELCHSGEEAVSRFRETDFDIAFMDVKLPGMNGVESFFEIRKDKPDAKVMMMTGYSVEELLQQAIDHGALGVLDKPLDIEAVLTAVAEAGSDGIVLVADDDPDFAESAAAALTSAGYKVLLAHDGQEAIDKVLTNSIDILVLDMRMPALSGLEVYMGLKKQGHVVPTLIVTGYREEEAAVAELSETAGVCCLYKPFDPKALLDSIENLLKA